MEKLNISFCYVHISDKLNDFISGTEEVIRATIILNIHLLCIHQIKEVQHGSNT